MAITLYPKTTESTTPEEFIRYVENNIDPDSDESVLSAAEELVKLSNNKQFLADFIHEQLLGKKNGGSASGFYTLRNALIVESKRGRFAIRVNFWTTEISNTAKNHEDRELLNKTAHDHNFVFLTVGYHGPGYETTIYEYDHERVEGYIGERVEFRFLEKTLFPPGKVMFYRPSKDLHLVKPAKALSITLNLLVMRKENSTMRQYEFDVETQRIIGYANSIGVRRTELLRMAAVFSNQRTVESLWRFAEQHEDLRTRGLALCALKKINPALQNEIEKSAERLPEPFRREIARAA